MSYRASPTSDYLLFPSSLGSARLNSEEDEFAHSTVDLARLRSSASARSLSRFTANGIAVNDIAPKRGGSCSPSAILQMKMAKPFSLSAFGAEVFAIALGEHDPPTSQNGSETNRRIAATLLPKKSSDCIPAFFLLSKYRRRSGVRHRAARADD
ncbi:MAG: hypothetical protein QOH39_1333 [Verrucomicrobiota bacterium]